MTSKKSIFKVVLLEVTIVMSFIFALGFAKQSIAAEDFSVSIGYSETQGLSELVNRDDVNTRIVPIEVTKNFGKLQFGVILQQVKVDFANIENQGIGDSILSLGYNINDAFSVSLKEKIATGDEKRFLSTGENDTLIQLDFNQPMMNPKALLFAQFGHRFAGKNNSLKTQDGYYAYLGTGYTYANQTQVGVKLNYQERLFSNLDDRLGLSAYINKPISDNYSLSAFAGFDKTETTTIGVSLTGKF